jgi:hypothetical protein
MGYCEHGKETLDCIREFFDQLIKYEIFKEDSTTWRLSDVPKSRRYF